MVDRQSASESGNQVVGSFTTSSSSTSTTRSVPGVRRANIAAAEPNSVTFDLTVRGGVAGLEQGLAGSNRLVRSASAGAQAVYRYQPQG